MIGHHLRARQVALTGASGPVYVSGRLVETRGQQCWLGPAEGGVLRALLLRPGEWVDLALVGQAGEVGLTNLVALLDGAVQTGSEGARLTRR